MIVGSYLYLCVPIWDRAEETKLCSVELLTRSADMSLATAQDGVPLKKARVLDAGDASRQQRAVGAIVGLLVGDALGTPMQWYYDLAEKDRDFGEWVDSYVDPKPDGTHFFAYVSKYRHEQGLRAGDVSQFGQIYDMLMQSIASKRKLDVDDFCSRLDDFIKQLSGESLSGRYTDGMWIQIRAARMEGKTWGDETATTETTSDGAMLCVILAALYTNPVELAVQALKLLKPIFKDYFITKNSVMFALTVQALINGVQIPELGA